MQDPDAIRDAVVESVRESVAQVGADRVAGLAFSSAMHGLIGLGTDGRPLTSLVT